MFRKLKKRLQRKRLKKKLLKSPTRKKPPKALAYFVDASDLTFLYFQKKPKKKQQKKVIENILLLFLKPRLIDHGIIDKLMFTLKFLG